MRYKIKIILAMLIFGSIGIFVRYINMPAGVIALARGIIGTLFLFFAAVLLKNKISFYAIRSNLWLLIFSGAAIGANWICLFEAYKYTTISTATLCYYLAPVFVVVLSPFLLKEKLTFVKIICIVFSLIGMFFVADIFAAPQNTKNNTLGIVFGICAALLYAAVVIMNKYLKNISAIDCTISQLFVSFIVLLPYVLLTTDFNSFSFTAFNILLLIFVGIVNTGVAYLLYFSSLQGLSGQTAAIFSYIDPITAILLSAVLLHEKMSISQVVGAILILGCTFVSEVVTYRQQAVK